MSSAQRSTLLLRPEQALLHPLWWLALVLMALNDHVFKTAGVLPDVLTGKLSDVTGLFFAPILLAVLLRVRTRRALLLCYAAVGVVFSALQVSPGFVGLWVDWMASIGAAWQVWSDPSDLLTLPMLWVSWRTLTPMVTEPQPVKRRLHQLTQYAGAGTSMLFCMANSPPPEPNPNPGEPRFVWESTSADIFIHNSTGADAIIRIRSLREDVSLLSCDAIAKDPGGLLQAELFSEAQTWEVPSDSNLPVNDSSSTWSCDAVYVDGDGFEPAVFFWSTSAYPRTNIPGGGESGVAGQIDLNSSALAEAPFSFAPRSLSEPNELSEACAVPDDAERLDWSDLLLPLNTPLVIEQLGLGPDGCYALDLSTGADTSTSRWYACIPDSVWPFSAGETISINEGTTEDRQTRFLQVDRVADAMGNANAVALRLRADSGGLPSSASIPVSFAFSADESCPLTSDACGSVSSAGTVSATAGGETASLNAGDTVLLPSDFAGTIEVMVQRAAWRPIVRSQCSMGPAEITEDIDIVVVQRGEEQ